MADPFDVLCTHRESIVLAELGALLHDLDKLSNDFILSTSVDHEDQMRNVYSHARRVEGDDPPQDNKDKHISRGSSYVKRFGGTFQGLLQSTALANQVEGMMEAIRHKIKNWAGGNQCLNSELRKKGVGDLEKAREYVPLSSFADWFIYHHNNQRFDLIPSLVQLLYAGLGGADGVDSEMDKGAIALQKSDKFYRASAFGYERVDDDKIDSKVIDQKRHEFCGKIVELLNPSKVGQSDFLTKEKRQKVLELAEEYFSYGLGETRRPTNDVTLYHHSYSAASLYKALLAKVLVEAHLTPNGQEYLLPQRTRGDSSEQQTQWHILSISFNVSRLLSRAQKVGDILGYLRDLDDLKDEIRGVLEWELPVGNEIYRDTESMHFVIPAFRDSELQQELDHFIRDRVQEILSRHEEIVAEVFRSEQPDQRLMNIINVQILKARQRAELPYSSARRLEDLKALERRMQTVLTNRREHGLCPICGLRPHLEDEEDACKQCMERRTGRAQRWFEQWNNILRGATAGPSSTIWIEEVADERNMVALISGSFDLKRWLDGTELHTFLAVTDQVGLAEPNIGEKLNDFLFGKKRRDGRRQGGRKGFFENLWNGSLDRCHAAEMQSNAGLLDWSPEDLKAWLKSAIGSMPKYESEDFEQLARDSLKTLPFTKFASPARIQRFWSTTKKFWQELEKQIMAQDFGRHLLRRKRLVIRTATELPEAPARTFDGILAGRSASFFRAEPKELITICNLENVFTDKEAEQLVEDATRFLQEQAERNKERGLVLRLDRRWQVIDIAQAKLELSEIGYIPVITVLLTPTNFQILVPASSTLEVLKAIREKYEEEFSKVRNRLPLNLSVVFFKHKSPLYGALEAAKRFHRVQEHLLHGEAEIWAVEEDPAINGGEKSVSLTLKAPNRKEYHWKISYQDGAGNEDPYHPNFELADGNVDELMKRRSYFTKGGRHFVHVKELKKGDKIKVRNGRFDFIYLDQTTRRHEIAEPRPHAVIGHRSMYYFDDLQRFEQIWETFKRHGITQTQRQAIEALEENARTKAREIYRITPTQRQAIEALLAAKRVSWKQAWGVEEEKAHIEKFIRSVLRNPNAFANDLDETEESLLLQACYCGEIFDVFEFYKLIGGNKDGDT